MFNFPELVLNHSFNNQKLLPVQMHSRVEISIVGLMVKTKLVQNFTNTTDKSIEAIHAIPIPVESTLVDFKIINGDKTWEGVVLEQNKADALYEKNLENADSAFQLKLVKEDLISLALGNLLSKETLSIELELIFPLRWIAGHGQLYLPLLIGERYGHSSLMPEAEPESNFLAQYPLEVFIHHDASLIDCEVDSPSHPLIQTQTGYKLSGDGYLDRDLVINFQGITQPTVQAWQLEGTEFGMLQYLSINEPKILAAPRDILFVLDCSGSMHGTPMRQLKKVIGKILNQMRPQDRFNLYPFGSEVDQVFEGLMPANEANITAAKRYIRRIMDAHLGGTEMVKALVTALTEHQKNRVTDVVLITDGEIWFEKQDANTKLLNAYTKQNNVRIFPIGVGHSTTELTVKELAEMSGGSYLLTNPNEDITFPIELHFKRLFNEPLSLNVVEKLWWKPKEIYSGDGVSIPLKLDKNTEQIEFIVRGKSLHETHALPLKKIKDKAMLKWVVSQYIKQLDVDAQIDLAVEHQVLTEHSDYLVQMQRDETEKTDEIPSLVKMPQMVAYKSTKVSYEDTPLFMRGSIRPSRVKNVVMNSESEPHFIGTQHKEIDELYRHLLAIKRINLELSIDVLEHYVVSEKVFDLIKQISTKLSRQELLGLLIDACQNSETWQDLKLSLIMKYMAMVKNHSNL
jgi:uncharacterized protein YegL